MTSFEEFRREARPGRWVPVVHELPLDMETAVSLLERWKGEDSIFLLESAEGGERWGRYSFLGFDPVVTFRSRGRRVEVSEGRRKRVAEVSDPLAALKNLFEEVAPVYQTLPRLAGGGIGFLAYDAVRFFEKLPEQSRDDLNLPELCFLFPRIVIVQDHHRHTVQVICNVRVISPGGLQGQYQRACRRIEATVRRLKRRGPSPRRPRRTSRRPTDLWEQTLDRRGFTRAVERVKEYIVAGDVTQTVLSIRFSRRYRGDPFELYRSLRQINPSPYLFFVKFGDLYLVGASPETMVHLEKGEMTLRPIAGTRPRGKTGSEDQRLEKELLADEKERAEHVMLVDLGRNDLGRVADPGSVRVSDLMRVERYSHVMHIVSDIGARLTPGRDAFDVIRATFPAGTLTGSPKIRAMEIIEELEPVRRAIYGGAVGYISFSGNMDLAITIRSALISKGSIYVQAGAGIVADSKPEREYEECVNKARAMMEAIRNAPR